MNRHSAADGGVESPGKGDATRQGASGGPAEWASSRGRCAIRESADEAVDGPRPHRLRRGRRDSAVAGARRHGGDPQRPALRPRRPHRRLAAERGAAHSRFAERRAPGAARERAPLQGPLRRSQRRHPRASLRGRRPAGTDRRGQRGGLSGARLLALPAVGDDRRGCPRPRGAQPRPRTREGARGGRHARLRDRAGHERRAAHARRGHARGSSTSAVAGSACWSVTASPRTRSSRSSCAA